MQFQLFSDSLNITAEYIELSEGTTLIEPQKRALHELTGLSSQSRLVLNNICLEDPARGTLFTNMPNVEFKNIKVRDHLFNREFFWGLKYFFLSLFALLFFSLDWLVTKNQVRNSKCQVFCCRLKSKRE